MTRSPLAALARALLLPVSASAGELAGGSMDDSATIGGQSMKLEGLGLRSVLRIKVYVSGLYLSTPGADPVTHAGGKAIKMHMLRALDASKIADSIEKGFDKNSSAEMPKLRARLDTLKGWFPSVEKGDIVTIAYIPGTGTTVWSGTKELGTIEGEDFAQAMFKVWFGPSPVQGSLRDGMLGK